MRVSRIPLWQDGAEFLVWFGGGRRGGALGHPMMPRCLTGDALQGACQHKQKCQNIFKIV